MQITDLVAIGSLGNSIDQKGFIPFKDFKKTKPESLKDIFLIFKDYRVRYVSVIDIVHQKSYKLKLDDREIAQEVISCGKVHVALPYWELPSDADLKLPRDLIGKQINFDHKFIGEVIDILPNRSQNILIVHDGNDREIMVPFVEYYIKSVQENIIITRNMDSLLEIYR